MNADTNNRHARTASVLLCTVGLFSCAAEQTETLNLPICRTGDSPSLSIGEGIARYEPRDEGATIGLVHGPQGGFHIEVGLEATYLDASEFLRGDIVVSIDDEIRAYAKPWLDFTCTEEGLRSFGTLLIFDGATPEALDGQVVDIEATVTDALGVRVTAQTTLVIEDLG